MSIQSNINQSLGIGAALLSQTPRAKEVGEIKGIKQNLKNIEKYDEYGTAKAIGQFSPGSPELNNLYEHAANLADIKRNLYIKLRAGEKAAQAEQFGTAIRNELLNPTSTPKNKRIEKYIKNVINNKMPINKLNIVPNLTDYYKKTKGGV